MTEYSPYSRAPKFGKEPHRVGDHWCPVLAGVIAAGEKNRFVGVGSADAIHDATRNERCGGFEGAGAIKGRLISAGIGHCAGVEWIGSHDPIQLPLRQCGKLRLIQQARRLQ